MDRWRGYPDSLVGDDIPLGSKIIAIADAYDAMTTNRSYRKALSRDDALKGLHHVKGSQLDVSLVECFAQLDLSQEVSSKKVGLIEPKEVVRNLADSAIKTENLEEVRRGLTYQSDVDESEFLKAIFEETPCGYVLLDLEGTVLFASEHYLRYRNLDTHSFFGSRLNDKIIGDTIEAGKVINELREEDIEGLEIFYELFSIPVMNDHEKIEYVIFCTIDRTEEIRLTGSFDQDFLSVIKLVRSLITRRFDKEVSEEQISKIEQRLSALERDVTGVI